MFVEPQHQPITTKPADPFTLPALIAWLETKPADGTYCFTDSGACLLTQWMRHCGEPVEYTHTSDFPRAFREVAMGTEANLNSVRKAADLWTWGQALTRARKALSDQQSGAPADREASL